MNTEEEVNKAEYERELAAYLKDGIDYSANTICKSDQADLEQLAADSFNYGYNAALQQSQSAVVAEKKGNPILEELDCLRNNLYNNVPTGKIDAFELISLISQHLKDFDNVIEKISLQSNFEQFALESIAENEIVHQQIENIEVGDKDEEIKRLKDALDACFGVMMQFTLDQPSEGETKLHFSVPYEAKIIIEARGKAEGMYYKALNPKG